MHANRTVRALLAPVAIAATVAAVTVIQDGVSKPYRHRGAVTTSTAVDYEQPFVITGATRTLTPKTICTPSASGGETCGPDPSVIVDSVDMTCPFPRNAIGGDYEPGQGDDVVLRGSFSPNAQTRRIIVAFTPHGHAGTWTPNVTCA